MAPAPVIRLHPDDGVLIARSSLPAGMVVAEGVTTVERIPAGHKVAIKPIAVGEPVRRYGQIIGFATIPIAPGQHVHTQNCGMGDFAKDYAFGVDVTPTPNFDLPAAFDGIRRPDGRVATRNYIGILTSVNCSAHVAGMVADVFKKNPFTGDNPLADFPNVDGVVALQCGGSDGYSGVSANPALGAASDLLVRHGGTVILSETPETYGAEHLLTRRAVSREVGEKLVALMRWWEEYTEREGAEMNANPSPGNKAGGLTTILEKSLGAMAKAGSTNLVDVVNYAEAITKKGFVFMDTPGYDPVAATGQVAGGANLVCFTTGRGSVFGCKPAPSIKLATNSAMFNRMEDAMDGNCGTILDGDENGQQAGERILYRR